MRGKYHPHSLHYLNEKIMEVRYAVAFMGV